MAVPKIRIKGFDAEWKEKSIGELCDVLTGFPFEGSKILPKGEKLLMRGINITEGRIRHSNDIDRYYNEYTSTLDKYRLEKNDLVVGMDGSKVGKNSALVTDAEVDSLLVQRVARLRNTNPHIIKLIQIALGSNRFYKYVDSKKTSSAIPHISSSDIKNFIVTISDDEEETQSIADYFQSLDSLIEATDKKIATLKQKKQASLQSMFPQEGETKPRVRFKGFEGDWSKTTFGDLLSFERPDNYIVTNDKYSDNYFTPVLTANKGFILGYTNETRTYNKKCIIFDDFTLDNKYVDFPFMVKSSALKILTLKKPEVDNLYFVYALLNRTNIEVLGHARHYISVVQPTEVLVPADCNEQKQIAEYFSNLDKQISIQEQRLEKLKQIKSACLKNMFV